MGSRLDKSNRFRDRWPYDDAAICQITLLWTVVIIRLHRLQVYDTLGLYLRALSLTGGLALSSARGTKNEKLGKTKNKNQVAQKKWSGWKSVKAVRGKKWNYGRKIYTKMIKMMQILVDNEVQESQ